MGAQWLFAACGQMNASRSIIYGEPVCDEFRLRFQRCLSDEEGSQYMIEMRYYRMKLQVIYNKCSCKCQTHTNRLTPVLSKLLATRVLRQNYNFPTFYFLNFRLKISTNHFSEKLFVDYDTFKSLVAVNISLFLRLV